MSLNAERRVYICNLASTVTEGDLKKLGETIGVVEKATVIRDERGVPRGNAYLTYSSMDAAARACKALHNFEIAGKQIKVGRLNAVGQVVCDTGEVFSLDTKSGGALTAQARAALVLQLAGVTSQAAAQLGAANLSGPGELPHKPFQYT